MSHSAPVARPHCSSISITWNTSYPRPPSSTAWLIALKPRSRTACFAAPWLSGVSPSCSSHSSSSGTGPRRRTRGPRPRARRPRRSGACPRVTPGRVGCAPESTGEPREDVNRCADGVPRGPGLRRDGRGAGRRRRRDRGRPIVEVGSGLDGDEGVDAPGKALLPGLFDCHVHLMGRYEDDELTIQHRPFSLRVLPGAREHAPHAAAGHHERPRRGRDRRRGEAGGRGRAAPRAAHADLGDDAQPDRWAQRPVAAQRHAVGRLGALPGVPGGQVRRRRRRRARRCAR